MNRKTDESTSTDPEILPPDSEDDESSSGSQAAILALISHYTDRPDLLLAEVEKHDPGFIQRMNASAEAHSEKLREGKFHFGRRQAYTSLSLLQL